MIKVDRSARILTSGEPVPEDWSHTELKENGQQRGYIVLTAEERAKGFVRPVRQTYVHVGKLAGFTNPDHPGYPHFGIELDCGERRLGGCGTETTMALAIAETYARDPYFYSGTFCLGCRKHLPLDEFVAKALNDDPNSPWSGTSKPRRD